MPRPPKPRAGILVACLVLLAPVGAQAIGELPDFQPFRSIATESTITQRLDDDPGTDPLDLVFELDARFRLAPTSNGILRGDDLHIQTAVAFPVVGSVAPGLGELAVRFSVAGDCFARRGRKLVFRLTQENRSECVEVVIEPFSEPFSGLLRRLDVTLAPRGGGGRWKLGSTAVLADPGFPLPVAGFADPKARLSGVTLVVGDDGMYSPPVTVGFRTLAP